MSRFITLIQFEIRKVLSQKKAFLFLLALNVVPLLAAFFSLLAFIKLKGWGVGEIKLSILIQIVKGLFVAHVKFFSLISPFFLALVIGDSFSGESGRGYLKTLLLTPVSRWQVVLAKAISVLLFLLIAITLGGLFLQINLWVAQSMTESPNFIFDVREQASTSTVILETTTAMRLLFISFVVDLVVIGYFIVFSLFFESPILMAFTSLIVLMALHTYDLMAPYLSKVDPSYGKVAEYFFTRQISQLSDVDTIHGLLEKNLFLTSPEVFNPFLASLGWAALFFVAALAIFQRKQILN